jgi:hypothetical protein
MRDNKNIKKPKRPPEKAAVHFIVNERYQGTKKLPDVFAEAVMSEYRNREEKQQKTKLCA